MFNTTIVFVICDQYIAMGPCSWTKTWWQHSNRTSFSSHTLTALQTFLFCRRWNLLFLLLKCTVHMGS